MQSRRANGFTLIEMAVVLAIIGLLVGGVMGAKYMLREAEVNSVISDFVRFKGAFAQFKQQYTGLPGDMADATDYWGTDPHGCPVNTVYTPRKETCPGNGNGAIDTLASSGESTRAWQQLADAGLISGTFSGVPGAGSGTNGRIIPNQNAPAGKRVNTGYTLYTLPSETSSNWPEFNGDYGTVVLFGAPSANGVTNGVALTAREAADIDLKLDDGKPGTGLIYTWRMSGCVTDTVAADGATAAYNLTTSGAQCVLGYKIDPQYTAGQ